MLAKETVVLVLFAVPPRGLNCRQCFPFELERIFFEDRVSIGFFRVNTSQVWSLSINLTSLLTKIWEKLPLLTDKYMYILDEHGGEVTLLFSTLVS